MRTFRHTGHNHWFEPHTSQWQRERASAPIQNDIPYAWPTRLLGSFIGWVAAIGITISIISRL